MASLTRAAVLRNIATPRVRKVKTPEWGNGTGDGDYTYVRALNAASLTLAAAIEEKHGKDTPEKKLARMCILGACNKDGKLLYRDKDIAALATGPPMPMARCVEVMFELSGMTEAAIGKAKKG